MTILLSEAQDYRARLDIIVEALAKACVHISFDTIAAYQKSLMAQAESDAEILSEKPLPRVSKQTDNDGWWNKRSQQKRMGEARSHGLCTHVPDANYTGCEQPGVTQKYIVNREAVLKTAQDCWESNVTTFSTRVGSKIFEATLGHKEFDIDCRIRCGSMIKGTTMVGTEHGKFLLDTNIKHNYSKYGMPFMQYPTTVAHCSEGKPHGLDDLIKVFAKLTLADVDAVIEANTALEPTRENIATLKNLLVTLVDEDELIERAKAAAARNRTYGSKGPEGTIKRYCTKLGINRDSSTIESVTGLLKACLTDNMIELIRIEMTEGESVPSGRKWDGYAAYSLLKKAKCFEHRHDADILFTALCGQ